MCGISGYASFVGPSQTPYAFVAAATQTLRHRGPDGVGYLLERGSQFTTASKGISSLHFAAVPWQPMDEWSGLSSTPAFLALGHNRLSIYDTSTAGHQPMCTPDQTVWVVFNGAIYNFKSLRQQLIAAGHSFFTETDTEVLLAAYRQWGDACLDRLEGMFAFVVWDRVNQLLWGARDRTGVKPLYWYTDGAGFAFASEQKAFWQAPGIQTGLREAGLFANLVNRQLDAHPAGLYERVQALLPGHKFTLSLKSKAFQTERYYHPPSTTNSEPAIASIRETLLHSIDLRRNADVPIGVAVSGGLDSSIVTGALHHLGEAPIQAFTATFPGFIYDESTYASQMVEYVQAEWHTCTPTADGFWEDLQDLVYTQESPIQSASTYAQYALMRQVRASGVKVLLDGQGGDELFAGYHIHQWIRAWEMLRKGRFAAFNRMLKVTGQRGQDYRLFLTQMAKRSLFVNLPARWQWSLLQQANPLFSWFKKDWVDQQLHQLKQLQEPIGDLQRFLQHQYFDGFLSYLLKFEDRNSMRFGIESRVPYADDPNLMQLLFNIAGHQKILPGQNKHLLRLAAGDLIPSAILERTDKVGFIAPTNQWLTEKKDWLAYFAYDSAWLDTARIRQESGKFDQMLSSDRFSHILPLLTTAIWEQTFTV